MSAIRFTIVCCALVLVAGGATRADVQPAPTGAEVLARAKAAAGGSALDAIQTLHLTQRVDVLGSSGTGQEYDDIATGRFAQFADLGPLSQGNGFDGARPWSQDPSGDAWPLGDYISTRAAVSAAYLTSLSFWYPSRRPGSTSFRGTTHDQRASYYVIRANPTGGFPVDIWIDMQTYLIRREIVHIPQGRDTVTTLGDYRQTGDVVLPYSSRIIANGNVIDVRVHEVAVNANIAKHLVMPATALTDFSITGANTTTIPFELVNNHLYITVRLNGKGPYRFIFDTGGQNVTTPEVAKQLGITVVGALQVSGAGANTVTTGFAWVPTLQIGQATLRHQAFAVLPIGKIMQAVEGEHIDGIVGVEVARRFLTTIDYEGRTMTFATRGSRAPSGTPVAFVYDQSVPQVAGDVDGLRGNFIIDTGNRASLVLYSPFVAAHNLLAKVPSQVRGITGYGLGGPSTGQLVRVRSMLVGTVPVTQVVTTLSLDTAGALTEPGTAGNIGGGILKRFTVAFDYHRQIMYLAPNSTYKKRETYDRSGLVLVQAGQRIRVIGALTGTPAYAVGIRSGDVIATVNGTPAAQIGLLKLRELLRGAPGAIIHVTVQSGESAEMVTFALRDYV